MTREERSDAIGSVRLAVDSTSGWLRTESWPSITDGRQAKVLRAHAAPQGMCDNLIDALKFWSNQQNDGDSPVTMAVQGSKKEFGSKKMGRLRRFVLADYFEAVKVCCFGEKTWSRGMCKQYTCLAHVFLMRILSACLTQLVVTVGTQPQARALTHAPWLKESPKQSRFIAQCHV